jgi:2TM domain-containing protein
VVGGEAGGTALRATTATWDRRRGGGGRGFAIGAIEPVLAELVIWVMTDPHGFFWPVFPIAGWGIGVIMNAWDVYGRQEITEEDIHREMDRLGK